MSCYLLPAPPGGKSELEQPYSLGSLSVPSGVLLSDLKGAVFQTFAMAIQNGLVKKKKVKTVVIKEKVNVKEMKKKTKGRPQAAPTEREMPPLDIDVVAVEVVGAVVAVEVVGAEI